ncbi:MAG TPA: response regulator [Pseudoxanthomonas sp.]|nr:response regulator [Pseudoxanthomonas sp.]
MDCGDATVLLIDDELEVRAGISRLLRSVGWKAEVFSSAEEFIARLPFTGVGCLVLDVSMPGMTGPELHDRIRETDSTLPIIYLTGRCNIATTVQAMKWGALDVLEKPVDDKVLLQAVAAAIERHRQDCLSREAKSSIASRLNTLSPRERQVLDQVMLGRLNKQIADDLHISLKTVKVHRGRAMTKMQVRSVAQLVHLCCQL